jgi:hypothetical protein
MLIPACSREQPESKKSETIIKERMGFSYSKGFQRFKQHSVIKNTITIIADQETTEVAKCQKSFME